MLIIRPNVENLTISKQKPRRVPDALPGGLLAKEPCSIPRNEWHTLFVEVRGEEVTAHLNGEHIATGSHPGVANRKAPCRFVVDGDHAFIDDLKIWMMPPPENASTSSSEGSIPSG